MKAKPIIIGVAGLQGSGKTTLARGIAKKFGWEFVAESATAMRYIPDLFSDMRRLAFEAQIGFFCNKAIALQERIASGLNVVLDRTLYEDAAVFANYFHQIAMIDDRAFATYNTLADYFTSIVPAPDLTIYCDCPVAVAKARIDARKRESQKSYPENHVEDIGRIYESWFATYDSGPLARIDSAINDFRDEKVIRRIADEVSTMLARPRRDEQQDLFAQFLPQRPAEAEVLVEEVRGMERMSSFLRGSDIDPKKQLISLPSGPFAYLAAPFTEFARIDPIENERDSGELIPLPQPHGAIPIGVYRRALLGIEKRLQDFRLETLIPHRDVNKWGHKTVLPGDVFGHCKLAVQQADLVVAVLGYSPGAHFEVGLAQGMGKPVLSIQCSEIPTSYLATGMASTPSGSFVASCKRVRDLPSVFLRPDVQQFLESAIRL